MHIRSGTMLTSTGYNYIRKSTQLEYPIAWMRNKKLYVKRDIITFYTKCNSIPDYEYD